VGQSQDYYLPGKPRKAREFKKGQKNVRELRKFQGKVGGIRKSQNITGCFGISLLDEIEYWASQLP